MARLYDTRKWRSVRDKAIRLASNQCQHCKRYGKLTPASTAHHIIPISKPYAKQYEIDNIINLRFGQQNLLALCGSCHDMMHDRQNDKLTTEGKKWVTKRFSNIPPSILDQL